MSKALIFALLFAGLPVAAYADEGGGAIGAIVRAPVKLRPASSAV